MSRVDPDVRIFCVDLDGTLCTNTFGEYERAEPLAWAIERVNELHGRGHRIIIFTARGATTGIDWSEETAAQLARWGVSYDELRLGKPGADVYLDDKALHVDAWRYEHTLSLELPRPGMARHGHGAEFGEGPTLPAPHSSAVVESGRTFAGRAPWVPQHVARALALAGAIGVPCACTAAELEAAVHKALGSASPLLAEDDDLIFRVELTGVPGASHLDLVGDGLGRGLSVSTRLVSQTARGLTRFIAGAGVRADSGGFRAPPGRWPLTRGDDGLRDLLGGELLGARESRISVPAARGPRSVITSRAIALALELGLEVVDGASVAEPHDELMIATLPFGLLPISELDGVPHQLGPVVRRLLEGWEARLGVDPLAQALRLADR